MPVNYDAIKEENLAKYGTDIGRIGKMLLADSYADRTHFIYEILQNTEDALRKRDNWTGPRTVKFDLDSSGLSVSHFGKQFDEADVRGVCGIGESTKELTDIGRFGIGFKSVYAYTDMPEIHSGLEHFAIANYVWPEPANGRSVPTEETLICLPFRESEPTAKDEVLSGLQRLGPRTLLFLREIEEVCWTVDGKASGHYRRSGLQFPTGNSRVVQIIGQSDDSDQVVEEWLVFSREVFDENRSIGYVEVAFELDAATGNELLRGRSIKSVTDSRLVVFFPTEVSTSLGFFIQGPYQTTPSRDNIPFDRPWNQHLVQETTELMVDSLKGLRELGLLNVAAFRCFPLRKPIRFSTLYEAVREALLEEPLIPAYNGKHIAGKNAKLARTRDLRELVGINRLSTLFPSEDKTSWVSDEVTQDRGPNLYGYLTKDLEISEITPDSLIARLTVEFLIEQPDSWIKRLYEFLNAQRGQLTRLQRLPLVRLEDGNHTLAYVGDSPQAYFPGDTPTDFPTVRRATCNSKKSREFLEALGIRAPDPVDDVIANIIPKYSLSQVEIGSRRYPRDIERILAAYSSDSREQRARLVKALNDTKFIAAVDKSSGEKQFALPRDCYLATERLTSLFKDVPGVLMVDNSRQCLRGERVRDCLRALDTAEYLVPIPVKPTLTLDEKRELRRKEGNVESTQEKSVQDFTLMGLDSLLRTIGELPFEQAKERAGLLWQALRNVQTNRRDQAFNGRYHWFWYTDRYASFDAQSVRMLRDHSWVPDKDDRLKPPSSVVFQETGWEPDPILFAKIPFKPPIVQELAKEAGIKPELLDDFSRLDSDQQEQVEKLIRSLIARDEIHHNPPIEPRPEVYPSVPSPREIDDRVGPSPAPSSPTDRPVGPREFITYVRVLPAEPEDDPDGLTHQKRMDLEERAIQFILKEYPSLKRTPTNNPGFDLFEADSNGQPIRWVEVKAMSGTLNDRPATLSHTQFKLALKKLEDYYLYVVEQAGNLEQSRIVKIRNPAGKAQTFTFDRGWVQVAE